MAKLLNFFKKSEAFSGGSFFAPGKYKVEEARFVLFDADGKWDNQSTVMQITLQPVVKGKRGWVPDKTRNEGNSVHLEYSAGDPKFFAPSKNGTGLVQAGDRETLSESCRFYFFLEHLEKAGFDLDQYDNDISVLEGYVFEMKDVPAPENNYKSNVDPGEDADAAKTAKKRTIPVVAEIVETPDGEASSSKKSGKKKEEEEEEEAEEQEEEQEETEEEEEKEEEEEQAGDDSPEDLLAQYIKSAVCVKVNVAGVKLADARSKVYKAMKADSVDPDSSRAVLKLLNDKAAVTKAVKAAGWKFEKDVVKK